MNDAPTANAVAVQLSEDAARGCFHTNMTDIIKVLQGFDLIMTKAEVPAFERFSNLLGKALARVDRYDDAASIFNASFVVQRGLHRQVFRENDKVTFARLKHDLEQFQYLAHIGVSLPPTIISTYKRITKDLQRFLKINNNLETTAMGNAISQGLDLGQPAFTSIHLFYNRAVYVPDPPKVAKYLNQKLNCAQIDGRFKMSEHGFVVIDSLLENESVDALWKWIIGTTGFFMQNDMNLKARFSDTLNMAVAYKISQELKYCLPNMLSGHSLQKVWSYKMSNEVAQGLGVHSDEGFINCNIWLTPSESNIDPSSGGLVIYKQTDIGDKKYNVWKSNVTDDPFKLQKLRVIDFDNYTVPYRANRAICFRSSLYHKTDNIVFKDGYIHRRVGVTFLFGQHS